MQKTVLALAWPYILLAVLTSVFVNLLFLTSPIYLTQIYQRVLASQSQNTLIALTGLMVLAFASLGLFERLRSWVFARLATRLDLKIAPHLLRQQLEANQNVGSTTSGQLRQMASDLDQIRRFFSGPGPAALIDLPMLLLYVAVMFAMHPWLGIYSLGCATLVVVLAIVGFWRQSGQSRRLTSAKQTSYRAIDQADRGRDLLRAQGLASALAGLLSHRRLALSREEAHATAAAQSWSSTSKSLRMILQSGVLGLAAYLVLNQMMTPALIFASMILLGRVMAPIDVLSNTWSSLLSSQTAWHNLCKVSWQTPGVEAQTGVTLDQPKGQISLQNLSLMTQPVQGEPSPILEDITADLPAGAITAIIGPSGAGKSSLLRLMAGLSAANQGQVLYDGIEVTGLAAHQRRALLSWGPQQPQFLPGNIAENLSGFQSDVSGEALMHAAKLAQIHDRITLLPQGYQTPIELVEATFSGGEKARLALARALFGPPKLILLDEPTAALEVKLRKQLATQFQALAKSGHSLIIATHDPILIQSADHILRLEAGRVVDFGPRELVMAQAARPAPGAKAPGVPGFGVQGPSSKASNGPRSDLKLVMPQELKGSRPPGSAGPTAPGTAAPGTTAPGTTAPGTTAPGTTAPGTTAPGATPLAGQSDQPGAPRPPGPRLGKKSS